jgi:DNA-binding NtrC family response regulator
MSEQQALVIGQAGSLREALAATMCSLTGITRVRQTGSVAQAVQMVKTAPVVVVLVDATSMCEEAIAELLAEVRDASPRTRCAVLSDGTALWAGEMLPAAVVLLGTPAAELRAIVGGLLVGETGEAV